jgi:hypothetical protein
MRTRNLRLARAHPEREEAAARTTAAAGTIM